MPQEIVFAKVKFYNPTKCFGFMVPDPAHGIKRDIFFHAKQHGGAVVATKGFPHLSQEARLVLRNTTPQIPQMGDRLCCVTYEGARGPAANIWAYEFEYLECVVKAAQAPKAAFRVIKYRIGPDSKGRVVRNEPEEIFRGSLQELNQCYPGGRDNPLAPLTDPKRHLEITFQIEYLDGEDWKRVPHDPRTWHPTPTYGQRRLVSQVR